MRMFIRLTLLCLQWRIPDRTQSVVPGSFPQPVQGACGWLPHRDATARPLAYGEAAFCPFQEPVVIGFTLGCIRSRKPQMKKEFKGTETCFSWQLKTHNIYRELGLFVLVGSGLGSQTMATLTFRVTILALPWPKFRFEYVLPLDPTCAGRRKVCEAAHRFCLRISAGSLWTAVNVSNWWQWFCTMEGQLSWNLN